MEYLSCFEKNILQGLYRFDLEWGGNDEPHRFEHAQLRWLHGRLWISVKDWPTPRESKTSAPLMTKTDDQLVAKEMINRKVTQSVQLLVERGLVVNSTLNRARFELRLTGPGIAMARRCDTCFGRLNLLYEQHKGGILGLLLTIAVSAATSFITTCSRT